MWMHRQVKEAVFENNFSQVILCNSLQLAEYSSDNEFATVEISPLSFFLAR